MWLLAAQALAFNSPEEGPWQIFVCVDAAGLCQAGTLLGEAWATDPGTSSSWTEYGERTSSWSFVTATQAWYVTVPTSQTLTCPSNGINCQKVGVSTTSAHRPKAAFPTAPAQGTQSYLEWHPNGKYEVTAYLSGGTTKVGYYYVSGTDDTRSERFCTPSGFKWPARAGGIVTWRVKWVDASAPPASCPGGWTLRDFTVDLTP